MDYRLIEASPGIRAILLPNAPVFTVVTVSDDYVSSTGTPRELLKERGFFGTLFIGPQAKSYAGETAVRKSLEYVLQNKSAHQIERLHIEFQEAGAPSAERYWKVQNVPVCDDAGDIDFIIYTAEDITGQIQAEHRKQEMEGIEKAYYLFMQAPVAVCIVSGEEHYVELANKDMLQLLGRTKEMVGKPLVHSLTEAKEQGLITILQQVYSTGKPYHAPLFPAEILINEKRQKRYFDLVFQPYYQSADVEKPTGIFCIAYNITKQVYATQKLQESQEELQLAIDAADLGTFRLDLITNQATNSERVNEWFGYTVQGYSREEGFNPIHPEDRASVDEVILNTLRSEANSQHDVTYRVVHPRTGQVRHLRSFGKTLFNEAGKPYLIIGIIQDVTSQILHQQQLKESETLLQQKVLERTLELENLNEELRRSNQNLEEFAYAASHDLKEPMRKIEMFSGRLADRLGERLHDEEKGYLSRITKATDRMNTLIDDLLMYSHVSKGAVLEEIIDLNQKVSRVLDDLEVEIEDKRAIITVGPLPTIKGHRRQLQQLFQNLIGNAIKYHKPGLLPEIHIGCRTLSADESIPIVTAKPVDHYYLIEIQDNGIGFEQEDAERIFNVFTRLHGNAEYRGTGVGLSIVRKVVENHGGYTWANSKPGQGATFKILLPVNK